MVSALVVRSVATFLGVLQDVVRSAAIALHLAQRCGGYGHWGWCLTLLVVVIVVAAVLQLRGDLAHDGDEVTAQAHAPTLKTKVRSRGGVASQP